MSDPPVVLRQRITWREGLTRKRRERFVERNVGQRRDLHVDRPGMVPGRHLAIVAGEGVVEAVLFVPRGAVQREREYLVSVGADAGRDVLGWLPPREVDVIVRVLTAPPAVRRALET